MAGPQKQTVEWNKEIASRYGLKVGETRRVACQYCGLKGYLIWMSKGNLRLSEYFHFDHIKPKSMGGDDSPDNIVISCAHCNWSKHHSRTLPKTLGCYKAKWRMRHAT